MRCQAKIEEEEGACEHAGQECAADSTDCNNYSVQISCALTYLSLYRCYILCTAVSTHRAFTGSEAPVLVEVISELM